MKNYKIIGLLTLMLFTVFSCKEQSDIISELDFEREFSPVGIEVDAVNHNSATISWAAMKGSTERFIIQLFQADSLTFAGSPIAEKSVEFAYETKLEDLLPEIQYSVRIKTVGETTDEDSKWHGIAFKTSSEQILTSVKNIKATYAVVNWTAGQTVTHLLLSSTDEEDIRIDLSSSDIAAGYKLLDKGTLKSNKTYQVAIYNGIGRRGRLSFKTLPIPDAATEVAVGADLSTYLTDGAILLLADGYEWNAPADASVELPANISIYGDPDAAVMPKIIGNFPGGGKSLFVLPETGETILLDNVEITQLNGLGGFSIFDQQAACNVSSVILRNCYIHDIERSVIRLRDKNCVVSSILLDGCLVNNVGYSGSNNQTFYFQASGGYVSEFKLMNSTFNSCGIKTQFIDNRPSADKNSSVIVENCTFYNVIAGDNNTSVRYLLTATVSGSSVVSLKMTNSILGKTFDAATAGLQGDANDKVTLDASSAGNFKTSDWATAASLNGGATTAQVFVGVADLEVAASSIFADPANYDLTLKPGIPNELKSAGDPRWR